jgi:hypothetical protein
MAKPSKKKLEDLVGAAVLIKGENDRIQEVKISALSPEKKFLQIAPFEWIRPEQIVEVLPSESAAAAAASP